MYRLLRLICIFHYLQFFSVALYRTSITCIDIISMQVLLSCADVTLDACFLTKLVL